MKYRKRPVVIEAIRWTGDNARELARFMGAPDYSEDIRVVEIHTLEGVMRADIGDWIIRGVEGEFYPCKPGIFAATYERVDG